MAANIGVLVVPQSLARLHHRRDLTYRPVTDAPESGVALSWREDATTDLVEDFIGIVRGRTVNSSRGRTQPEPEGKQRPGKSEGRKPAAGARKGAARGSSGAAKGGRGGPGGAKGAGARRGKPKRKG